MPDIGFFFDEVDTEKLTRFLLSERYSFIPDLNYSEPKLQMHTKYEAIEDLRNQKPSFFLTRSDFAKCPLEIRKITGGKADRRYYHMQRNGGPVFHYICPGTYLDQGHRKLGPSSVAYYPTYWNTTSHENEKVPPEQVAAFKVIRNFIKENSIPTDPKGLYVGSHAAEQYRADQLMLVGSMGYAYGVLRSQ